MAARNLLHKRRLQEFLDWCKAEKGLNTAPGSGDFQLARIQAKATNGKGQWHVIYERLDMPEHVTVPEPLIPLVLNFLRSTKKKPLTPVVPEVYSPITTGHGGPDGKDNDSTGSDGLPNC
jgi:hypothetical protein